MPKKPVDHTGKKFGMLTAVEFIGKRGGKSWWRFLCDCGEEHESQIYHVTSGATISCGCRKEKLNLKHGHARKRGERTRTYGVWLHMRDRCTNPNNERYARYGCRGIKVCERWNDFQNFLDDMGEAPNKLTIDRIDNDGNYEPDNCRWATVKRQASNKSTNRYLEYGGRRMMISEWERELGLHRGSITKRLSRGWSLERALTTPSPNK